MIEVHEFRCGDTARIDGSAETVLIAYADREHGRASWFGWPPGDIELSRLVLVEACSDDEHRSCVRMILDGSGNSRLRDDVERLYRPIAYWTRICKQRRAEADEAIATLDRCEAELRFAQSCRVDVEPLPPEGAQRA